MHSNSLANLQPSQVGHSGNPNGRVVVIKLEPLNELLLSLKVYWHYTGTESYFYNHIYEYSKIKYDL